LTLSGLSPWTSAGRAAFGMDFLGRVADNAGKAFGDLDAPFRDMLTRFGIESRDWDVIRATQPYRIYLKDAAGADDPSASAPFIRPADIATRTDIDADYALVLASRLADALGTLTEFAVPTESLAVRAVVNGFDRPGSLAAIVKRSTAMYHSFGGIMLLTHGRQMMALRQNPARLAKYGASLAITATFGGAIAIQTRQILKGHDPRDMTDWRFWVDAAITGGSLGLLGDFVYAGVNGTTSSGHGLATFSLGPIGGAVSDVVGTILPGGGIGAVGKAPGATAKNFPTRALELSKGYLPGGNLWYARLVMEREIWDQLQERIDPGFAARSHRIERWYQRQFHNQYWWHIGDTAPSRAPDISAVGGQK
jgi:hypothetical protein